MGSKSSTALELPLCFMTGLQPVRFYSCPWSSARRMLERKPSMHNVRASLASRDLLVSAEFHAKSSAHLRHGQTIRQPELEFVWASPFHSSVNAIPALR